MQESGTTEFSPFDIHPGYLGLGILCTILSPVRVPTGVAAPTEGLTVGKLFPLLGSL